MLEKSIDLAGGFLGEVNEKFEWGLGFLGKYANYILLIAFVWVLAKVLKLKITI